MWLCEPTRNGMRKNVLRLPIGKPSRDPYSSASGPATTRGGAAATGAGAGDEAAVAAGGALLDDGDAHAESVAISTRATALRDIDGMGIERTSLAVEIAPQYAVGGAAEGEPTIRYAFAFPFTGNGLRGRADHTRA
jgi:hypothetical protein